MPKTRKEYKFLGTSAWDKHSDDGKIFFALFEERIVDNVRHAAALCPIRNNFDSVIKYILKFVPALDILQYAESSIRTALRRLKSEALGISADARNDDILSEGTSDVAQQAAAAAVAASGVRSPSPARPTRPATPTPAPAPAPRSTPRTPGTPIGSPTNITPMSSRTPSRGGRQHAADEVDDLAEQMVGATATIGMIDDECTLSVKCPFTGEIRKAKLLAMPMLKVVTTDLRNPMFPKKVVFVITNLLAALLPSEVRVQVKPCGGWARLFILCPASLSNVNHILQRLTYEKKVDIDFEDEETDPVSGAKKIVKKINSERVHDAFMTRSKHTLLRGSMRS